jgi:hypothetical protein
MIMPDEAGYSMPDPTHPIGVPAPGGQWVSDGDRAWVDRFLVQLGRQRMPPEEVSKALAQVRSHCADSGQSAQDAFGDPAVYATNIAAELPPAPNHSVRSAPFSTVRGVSLMLPMTISFALLAILYGANSHGDAVVSWGQLVVVVAVIPLWVIAGLRWVPFRPRDAATPHRPAGDEKGWRALFAILGLVAGGAALWIIFDRPAFSAPRWSILATAITLFVLGFALHRMLTPGGPKKRPE